MILILALGVRSGMENKSKYTLTIFRAAANLAAAVQALALGIYEDLSCRTHGKQV
jgi:hypothetical protein